MQNVLIDDRRIWVDLSVISRCMLSPNAILIICAVPSPWRVSIRSGRTMSGCLLARAKAALLVATTWRRRSYTGRALEMIGGTMVSCSTCPAGTSASEVGAPVGIATRSKGDGRGLLGARGRESTRDDAVAAGTESVTTNGIDTGDGSSSHIFPVLRYQYSLLALVSHRIFAYTGTSPFKLCCAA